MPAYKDERNGTWYVFFRYTDWKGERKPKLKRGFRTKKEALAFEREFLVLQQGSPDMTFGEFVKIYEKDTRPKMKENTWLTKENIIKNKLLPYFGKRKLSEITAKNVMDWQNEMRKQTDDKGKPLSLNYLKTVHNQLSAIFNHAVRYYNLSGNPARKAGNMASEQKVEMKFWVREEYDKFAYVMMEKPMYYHAFQMLYWTGIREGELLALTPADFDFNRGTVSISKSYQRIKGRDVITTPKTQKSNRIVQMPRFLCEEMQEYFDQLYGLEPDYRLFPITKNQLTAQMRWGCQRAGVKRIRIHDLRHSHVSLLIDMGFSALAIADRVGHETIDITYRYAHLFPSVQREMVQKLDLEWSRENVGTKIGQAQPMAQ